MSIFEKFSVLQGIPTELLSRLDRNFDRCLTDLVTNIVTTNFTFTPKDKTFSVQANATLGAITVTLPSQPVGNRRRTVTKTDASANAVTVSGNGSLINGAATYVLAAQYNTVTVEPTGTGWLIV